MIFYFLVEPNLSLNGLTPTTLNLQQYMLKESVSQNVLITYIQFYLPGLGKCARSASAKHPSPLFHRRVTTRDLVLLAQLLCAAAALSCCSRDVNYNSSAAVFLMVLNPHSVWLHAPSSQFLS